MAVSSVSDPAAEPLRFFGAAGDRPLLEWSWVVGQLTEAGTFWVVAGGAARAHPRPVWGVWEDGRLILSLGSPVLRRQLANDAFVTVHLDSGTDVVILEGRATGHTADPADVRLYDEKYDWHYDADQYGPLTVVTPTVIMAWRAAGPAGRDGFATAGRWAVDPDSTGQHAAGES